MAIIKTSHKGARYLDNQSMVNLLKPRLYRLVESNRKALKK